MNHQDIEDKLQRILDKSHASENKRKFKKANKAIKFACPKCGDSSKNDSLKRAAICFDKAEPYFYCHHECGGQSIHKFFEEFGETYSDNVFDFFTGPIKVKRKLRYDPKQMALEEVSRLAMDLDRVKLTYGLESIDENHPVYSYVSKRQLTHKLDYLLYWPKAKRLVILNCLQSPCLERRWNEQGDYLHLGAKVIGFQARDLTNKASVKYLTYSLERMRADSDLVYDPKEGCEDYIKMMGGVFFSTEIDTSKQILVTEGPIDAMCLPNAMALCGSSKNITKIDENPNIHYVFDNDETGLRKAKDKMLLGKTMFNWPMLLRKIGVDNLKDINEVVMHCKMTDQEIPEFKSFIV